MIEVTCGCPGQRNLPESVAGKRFRCPTCGQEFALACAETLAEGAGLGDFDAQLTVIAGPEHVGLRLLLGGVTELAVGKRSGCNILLPGIHVSDDHCRLVRVNFGPSIWKIVDDQSDNGLFANGQRVGERELQDGDIITIGEYDLKFDHVAPPASIAPAAPTAAAAPVVRTGGPTCPSCARSLPPDARICVNCGIHVDTGRPVLTRSDVDENSLHETGRQIIWFISWFMPLQPIPLPLRSEAFGTHKPYAIWAIALITVLASIAFYVAQHSGDDDAAPPGNNLKLWPMRTADADANGITPEMVQDFSDKMDTPVKHVVLHHLAHDDDDRLSDDEAARRVLEAFAPARGDFHWYQLLTSALLHDTSGIFAFIMHLGGNLLFLLVFGTRVNALIGNIATAIVYPILAIGSGAVYLLAGPSGPMLGASGAIMGLAGMCLILFPAHRVYCAMWISIPLLAFRRIYACKIFPMRGFWVLLLYFGYDILMNVLNAYVFHSRDGVAHWAHIGGFSTGMVLGLLVLASRMFNPHGGDLLSVTLGRHAWPLIGKPSQWATGAEPPAPPVRATPLNYA